MTSIATLSTHAARSLECPKEGFAFANALVIASPERVLEAGAIVMKGSRIVDCLAQEQLDQRYPGIPQIDCQRFVITPGLINAHTHAAMGFFRGLGWGQPATAGNLSMIETFLFPAEKCLDTELIEPLSYSYLCDALSCGVTTVSDHYYFVAGVGKALQRLGMRGVIGETIADLGGAFPTQEHWQNWRDTISEWPFGELISPAIAPHAADTVSERLLKELADFATSHNLPLHLHLSQTKGERARVLQRVGKSPVAYAESAGALGPLTLAVHLVSVDQDDIALLKQSGATAVICPASQIIYERLAPIKDLWTELPVAIATDCAASNDTADVQNEARWCGLLLRHEGVAMEKCTAKDLLASVTTIPAKALGKASSLGQIAAGYQADLLFYEKELTHAPRQQPLNNFFFSMQSRHLKHVMIAGEWRLWNQTPCSTSRSSLEKDYERALSTLHGRLKKI